MASCSVGSLRIRRVNRKGRRALGNRFCRAVIVALAVLLCSTGPAMACDPCGLHSSVQVPGVVNALRTTGMQADALTVGVQEQFATYRVRGENDLRTTETDLELIRTLSVSQLSVGYNLSSSIALQGNVPFVVRSYDRFERFEKVRETESGLGDSSLLATYSPYSFNDLDSRFFVAGVAGLKVPTGDTGSLKRVASEGEDQPDNIQGRGLTLGTARWMCRSALSGMDGWTGWSSSPVPNIPFGRRERPTISSPTISRGPSRRADCFSSERKRVSHVRWCSQGSTREAIT